MLAANSSIKNASHKQFSKCGINLIIIHPINFIIISFDD
uniref:Bm14196 n=1 Tax=Brugia malayi TaxID=6279 RepID=A0A1I9FZP3_BRUMA|nr:Bm14196 [Brugia malayi]